MGKRGPIAKNKLPTTSTVEVACPTPYKRTKEDEARDRRYKAEDGLRALQRADECRKDKQLMKDIKSLAEEQMSALKKIK